MADPKGFLKYDRRGEAKRAPDERIDDYDEFVLDPDDKTVFEQASRCMDCGIPFCHQGCPVENLIPEWNELARRERWNEAYTRLKATNNFPEVTGRVCPAPCEEACVLNIDDAPVSIKLIERVIADRAWQEGWEVPQPPSTRHTETIGVIGSGPAGLAAAQQLARSGYTAVVYERDDRAGGLLTYGIPDFKLDKEIVDRRIEQMEAEGVQFRTGVEIGEEIAVRDLLEQHDAILVAVGAPVPRDLPIPGRHLLGIEYAMDYLTRQNEVVYGDWSGDAHDIDAEGKNVIVIGDGDTGSDCVGTANRQKASSITQFARKQRPPERRDPATPWPDWAFKLRTSESHEEGCRRVWGVNTRRFLGSAETGRVVAVETIRTEDYVDDRGRRKIREIAGTEERWPADLVLLAIGFEGPASDIVEELALATGPRGNIMVDGTGMTNHPGVFAAGDCVRGASLVVWAIHDGRVAAEGIQRYLKAKRKDATPRQSA